MKHFYFILFLIIFFLVYQSKENYQVKRKASGDTDKKAMLSGNIVSKISYEYHNYKIDLVGCIKYKNNNTNKANRYQLSRVIPQYSKATKSCIELIDDLCLVYVNISILSPEECTLNYFYNYVQKTSSEFDAELQALTKGLGLTLLKTCMQKAIRDEYLKSDAKVTLYASGQKESKEDMIGLIQFYEYLGLKIVGDKSCLERNICFMEGNVQSILDKEVKETPLLSKI